MDKDECILNESFRLFDAPPVAFTTDFKNINSEKKVIYKIITTERLSILSSSKNKNVKENKKFNLKIGIESDILKKQDKKVLFDIINFIKNACNLSLKSRYLIFNNSNIEINPSKTILNEFVIELKQKNEIKLNGEYKKTEHTNFYCSNHNRYFKTKEDLQRHCKAKHKFKCEKCGLFFSLKSKLDKHLLNQCNSFNKNNNNINTKNKSQNIPINKTINENDDLKLKRQKERKQKEELKNNEEFKKKKEQEEAKKMEELKRKEEIKKKEEERKIKEELKKKKII